MFNRANRQKEHRPQASVLPNAAVVYAVGQNVEQTFEYLRSDDRISLPFGNIMVALASVGQLLGLAEGDIERFLNLAQKEPSLALTGMSYSEFVDAIRCLAVLHGHLALEALPALQVPDLSKALYDSYMLYSQALRPHPSGAVCRCRQVAGEPPPRLFWESFLRLCRDAGFVAPDGPLPLAAVERIWLGSSSLCEKYLPEHMCFAQFLHSLAVISGQVKSEVFVPVAALGLAQEVPALRAVPSSYRLKHYKEVPLNLGGKWALPHLCFEELAKAVQEGRQYEYAQFLRDAQETANRDETQRQQLAVAAAAAPGGGAGAGASAARRGGGGGGGGTSAGGNGGRVRPWSAGLTVLSPHPRRREAAGPDDWAGGPGTPSRSPTAHDGGPYAASSASRHAGGCGSSGLSPAGSRPAGASVLNGWLGAEDCSHRPHHASAAQPTAPPRDWLLSPTSNSLERRRSAIGATAAPPPPPPPGGVEGGGRVCLDSARPRALHPSNSFSNHTSPRTSLVAAQGGAAAGAAGGLFDGGRPGLSRVLSRRSVSNADGPLSAWVGGGSSTCMLSPRGGGGAGAGGGGGSSSGWVNGADAAAAMAVEYCAAGVRELRRDVEGRLGFLEEQGRQVVALLGQLQQQMAAMQQQPQQPLPSLPSLQLPPQQPQEPFWGAAIAAPAVEYDAAASGGSGGSSRTRADVRGSQQQPQEAAAAAAAGGGALRTPPLPSSPRSSWSPSRPSSAREGDGRDTARYGVVVRTSDAPGAGTDADVFLTIYGDKGDTGERLLSNGAFNFERGRVSTFVFTAADVGEVRTVRVRMRGQQATAAGCSATSSPSWHLDSIQVASAATGTCYRFPHRGWVDNVLGRECILHCKGTAPDTDGDPPGWQPTPPRAPAGVAPAPAAAGGGGGQQPPPASPPRCQSPLSQSPPRSQSPSPPRSSSPQPRQQPPPAPQQQPQAAAAAAEVSSGGGGGGREEVLSPCPTLTPRGTEGVRQPLSPLSNPMLPSPPSDAASSPVAPPGFTRGVVHDGPSLDLLRHQQQQHGITTTAPDSPRGSNDAAASGKESGTANGDRPGDGAESGSLSLPLPPPPPAAPAATAPADQGATRQVLEERIAELERRLQQVEEAQADSAMRTAAAIAAAVLVRAPAPLLAAVRRPEGAGGGVTSDSEKDSALALLADVLTHVHTRAEQGVAAASAADATAAAALDASRRHQSRLAQLQFELSATSVAAEAASTRSTRVAEQLEALMQPPPQPPPQEQKAAEEKEVPKAQGSQAAQDSPRAQDSQRSQVSPSVQASPRGQVSPSVQASPRAQASPREQVPYSPRLHVVSPRIAGGALGGVASVGSMGSGAAMEYSTAALAEAVRYCNVQLGVLSETVKQVTAETGAAAAAAAARAEELAAGSRAHQARLAASLADVAVSLAAQRQAREAGRPLPVSPHDQESAAAEAAAAAAGDTDGADGKNDDSEAASLRAALASFQHELLQWAQAVAAPAAGGGTGAGAGEVAGASPEPGEAQVATR